MTWFAFQGLNGGKAINLAGTQEKQAVVEGFHGYGTEAQAEAQPNSINFLTRGLADVWIADYNKAVQEGAQPGGPNNITTPSGLAGAAITQTPLAGFADLPHAIESVFQVITDGKMWRSLGWILLGILIMLIGIGLWFGKEAVKEIPSSLPIAGAFL